MAYYTKNTTNLSTIGKEAFDVIDAKFSNGHSSNYPSEATAPLSWTTEEVCSYKYHPQQAYVIQKQVYDPPVAARMTERVINCNEAAKMYGGTVFVDYPKRKPARKGFLF